MGLREAMTHRPWPVPDGPWIMEQTWHNLLFAHWPVPVAALRALVPAGLTIDTFGGQAWLGVIAFRLTGIRLRGTPPLPGVSRFPEINLRTYVTCGGKPGVLFLSMDADNRLGIALARPWFRLPYCRAAIRFAAGPDGVAMTCRRTEPGAPPAQFVAHYGPAGPVGRAAPGSLAAWLTERYCYYSADGRGRLARCEIAHPPWPLQVAAAQIGANTLAAAVGLPAPAGPPLLHYAHRIRAVIWPVRRVTDRSLAGAHRAAPIPG
ncbi:MAG TPA: DUF2071 domain-containing protein [Chloroflexia bacterium]|nr:DUF2071 domain-containing protein [Chloroflexia bacterium]